jgi:molybdenum cofactor biosynthesis enzyme MoaA
MLQQVTLRCGLQLLRISDGEWVIELKRESHPKEIMIELTTACNYNCVFCFRRATGEPLNGFMSPETFEKVLEQAISSGVEKVSFTGWGETLVHPRAVDFIKAAKRRGLKVLVATNGALLDRFADELVNLNVDEIYVSVDSVKKEVYNMLRVGGELSNVTRGLMKLKDKKVYEGKVKPEVTLQMTLNTYNAQDLDDLPTYGIKVGATKSS